MSITWTLGSLKNATDRRFAESDDLNGRVFSMYHRELDWCARMRRDPRFSDELIRTVETIDGRLITQLYIVDRPVRIGRSVLRMGGIAAVGTDPAFRKHGMASALMQDALQYLETAGYDISVLFSIPADFYDRFGYRTVLPDYATTISGLDRLTRLSRMRTDFQTRPLSKTDLVRIAPLYEATYATTPCSCLRDTAHWAWLRLRPDFGGVLITDSGRPYGYALTRTDGGRYIVHEVGATASPRVHDALLRALAHRALAAGVTDIRLELPPDRPFTRLCLIEHGGVQTTTVPRNRGGMARIINLRTTMAKLEPELSDRIARSALKDAHLNIVLDTDIGAVRLTLDPGRIHTVGLPEDHEDTPDISFPQSALIGLLLGFCDPSDVQGVWGRPLPDDVLPALTALFPSGCPHLPWVDHF